jgi:hypothetical protein
MNLDNLIFNPGNVGALDLTTGTRHPELVVCRCGTIGLDQDEHPERVGYEHVSACTCGIPICDDCWEVEQACPHNTNP